MERQIPLSAERAEYVSPSPVWACVNYVWKIRDGALYYCFVQIRKQNCIATALYIY